MGVGADTDPTERGAERAEGRSERGGGADTDPNGARRTRAE